MQENFLAAVLGGGEGADKRIFDQLSFLFEIEKLKAELRTTQTYEDKEQTKFRRENAAEHSWHIAMFAMLLKEYAAEEVNVAHVTEMMLVHELVEIYAGDTNVYTDVSPQLTHEREAQAATKIFSMLPPDQAVHFRNLWDEFEANQTPESRYARSIDRVHPILRSFLNGGWKSRGLTYDKVVGTHSARVSAGAPALWAAIKKALDYGRDYDFFAEPGGTTPP